MGVYFPQIPLLLPHLPPAFITMGVYVPYVMKQNNAVTMGELVENANEGDEMTITYNSASADTLQELTGEVLEAGRSWNGKVIEAEIKNSDGNYQISVNPDDDTGTLERVKYDWFRGERTAKAGTVRLTQKGDLDPVKSVEVVDNSASYTCWECGAEFDREADHNHHVEVSH